MSEQNLRVKSAGTMFEIVEALKRLDRPSVVEVAQHVDLPKSTTHDHLSTLTKLGFVAREPDGYRLGARFLEYGGFVRENMKVYRVARPVVERLAAETGDHANLMIEEHGLGIFLYTAKGENAVNLDTYPGMRVPLHTTALGKAILAHCPREKVDRIIDEHGLQKETENSITDRETLFEQCEQIRGQGYATDNEERGEGVRCVAAPILNQNDEILAAVSVSGPVSRIHNEVFKGDLPQRVQSAANVIELNMTYS